MMASRSRIMRISKRATLKVMSRILRGWTVLMPSSDETGEDDANETVTTAPSVDDDDPFRGERPAIHLVETPMRRDSDKIIDLETRRPRLPKDGLSPGEQAAFREIGVRLTTVPTVHPTAISRRSRLKPNGHPKKRPNPLHRRCRRISRLSANARPPQMTASLSSTPPMMRIGTTLRPKRRRTRNRQISKANSRKSRRTQPRRKLLRRRSKMMRRPLRTMPRLAHCQSRRPLRCRHARPCRLA